MGAHIVFKRPDGHEAKGYLANAARGDAPGVVVIQEMVGPAGADQGDVRPFRARRLRRARARPL
jgi:dienelactone hydrolase